MVESSSNGLINSVGLSIVLRVSRLQESKLRFSYFIFLFLFYF